MTELHEETVLRVSRRFAAPRERVFDAWTNPDVLRTWWSAQPTWRAGVVDVDLREGGSYRLSMMDPESGVEHTVGGEYTEVRRPERLAFTWTWESNPEEMRGSDATVVEIDFMEDGDGTEVVLTHSGFANGAIRDLHTHGWTGILEALESRVFAG